MKTRRNAEKRWKGSTKVEGYEHEFGESPSGFQQMLLTGLVGYLLAKAVVTGSSDMPRTVWQAGVANPQLNALPGFSQLSTRDKYTVASAPPEQAQTLINNFLIQYASINQQIAQQQANNAAQASAAQSLQDQSNRNLQFAIDDQNRVLTQARAQQAALARSGARAPAAAPVYTPQPSGGGSTITGGN